MRRPPGEIPAQLHWWDVVPEAPTAPAADPAERLRLAADHLGFSVLTLGKAGSATGAAACEALACLAGLQSSAKRQVPAPERERVAELGRSLAAVDRTSIDPLAWRHLDLAAGHLAAALALLGGEGPPTPSPRPWSLERDEVVIGNRWVTVRSQALRTGAGHLIEPFFLVEAAPWVCLVAQLPDTRLVLVEQYRHGAQAVARELPAGNIDPGEDAAAAGIRELAEETGFRPRADPIPLGTFWPEPARSRASATGYVIPVEAEPGPTAHEASEDMAVRLVPLADCFGPTHGGIIHAAQLGFLHLARPHLRR
jgi:8-oxo-dGTP pyrophosphatase MutT (NUDIX family)